MMNLADLKRPFPPEAVHWRVGSTNKDKTRGMALAYIDARDVMDRLDEVCGIGWQSRFEEVAGRIVCSIGLIAHEAEHETWVWRADGAGNTDFEPEKGGLSDAFKRAAVQWGIGRYLYDVPAPWVAIEAFGKSYKIADSELPKLRALLAGNAPSARQDERGDAGGHDTPPPALPLSDAPQRANARHPIRTPEDFEAAIGRATKIEHIKMLDNILMDWIEHDHHPEAERKRLGDLLQAKLEVVRNAG